MDFNNYSVEKIYGGNEEALILSKITLVLTKKKQKPHRLC